AVLREAASFRGYRFSALTARLSREVRILRETSLLGRHTLAALTGNCALLFSIHRSKAAIGRALLLLVISRHEMSFPEHCVLCGRSLAHRALTAPITAVRAA